MFQDKCFKVLQALSKTTLKDGSKRDPPASSRLWQKEVLIQKSKLWHFFRVLELNTGIAPEQLQDAKVEEKEDWNEVVAAESSFLLLIFTFTIIVWERACFLTNVWEGTCFWLLCSKKITSTLQVVVGEPVSRIPSSLPYNVHFPFRRGDLNLHPGVGGSLSSILLDLQVLSHEHSKRTNSHFWLYWGYFLLNTLKSKLSCDNAGYLGRCYPKATGNRPHWPSTV